MTNFSVTDTYDERITLTATRYEDSAILVIEDADATVAVGVSLTDLRALVEAMENAQTRGDSYAEMVGSDL